MIKTYEKSFKDIVFRLAHFDPSYKDECGYQFLDYLVLNILATFGFLGISSKDVKENIYNTFKLNYECYEIDKSGKRLASRNVIEFIEGDKFNYSTFKILSDAKDQIDKNLSKVKELEKDVFDKWKNEIYERYKRYPKVIDNLEIYIENLKLFLSKVLIKHGVDCVALLYPNSRKIQDLLKKVESPIFEKLPSCGDSFVDSILKLEIPRFFYHDDINRLRYITSLFNSSFYWHLSQVDEKCSEALLEVTKGQKLFLDNNILYSLIGLSGKNILEPMYNILKIANDLGYSLWVTYKTIEEFNSSLRWRIRNLKTTPTPPIELMKIALESFNKDNFITIYWEEVIKSGISLEDFIVEKSHIDEILVGLNINKTDEFRKEIEGSKTLREEMRNLRLICPPKTNEIIIEHDAFHKLFIEKIRGNQKQHFSEAVAWFLTHDNKLPIYNRLSTNNQNFLPFCLTSNQWVQINRPFLPRSKNFKDYEETFHLLIAQPLIRSLIPAIPIEKAYSEVTSRLSRYEDMGTQIALKIVGDKQFMINIATKTDENKINYEVDNKILDITKQIENENKELQNKIKEEKDEIKILSNKIDVLKKYFKNQNKRNHWVIYLFSIVVCSLIIWFVLPFIPITLNILNKILVQILVLLILLFIPFRSKRIIAIIIGLIGTDVIALIIYNLQNKRY